MPYQPTPQSTPNNSKPQSFSYTHNVIKALETFYHQNPQIKQSHGIQHAKKVHQHSIKAIQCCCVPATTPLNLETAMEIEVASLLHDVDDSKYFPKDDSLFFLEKQKEKEEINEEEKKQQQQQLLYPNAIQIMTTCNIPPANQSSILQMISWVSCSTNGNSIPPEIIHANSYHLLIPRWSDRLEAVGSTGVIRCYQYNREHNLPLSSRHSPRPSNEEEVWSYATPNRFRNYQKKSGGQSSQDMISHYYDKLLHIAKPPKDCVRNEYLEKMAEDSSRELVEVCVRFGRTGVVDEEYICSLVEEDELLVVDENG